MQHLKGTPLSPGIAVGPLFCLKVIENRIVECPLPPDGVEAEIALYRFALAQVKNEIQNLQAPFFASKSSEGVAILDGYLQILDDPLLTEEIIFQIQFEKKNAEFLFHRAMYIYQKQLHSIGNAYFKERVCDLRDIEQRVLRCIKGEKQHALPAAPEHAILFAKELSPSDIAAGSESQIKGFVTQYGGATSHAAIVLQAKRIPFISSIDFALIEGAGDVLVIIDGETGDIFVDPEEDIKFKYLNLCNGKKEPVRISVDILLPSETYDGHAVRLSANTELMHDLSDFQLSGASGVGLFRSEYLFISRDTLPSEEEQFIVYREIMEKVNGSPIAMRTFDFGGDKYFSGQKIPLEHNPFLGCRAIRWLLKEKAFFKSQLKAILRAAEFGNVSILFPMISSLSELLEAKVLLGEAQAEIGHQRKIPIGCMIEVPSAAIIADLLAKECDFLSIGTNDLVQYALAVDRGNSLLGNLYTPNHPSILRLIKFIVDAANNENIPVSICGEAAADLQFLPLLLGLGVHELSVALHRIPSVKAAIRRTSISEARQLAQAALKLPTSEAVEQLLRGAAEVN